MDINFSAIFITQDKIPRSCVFELYFSVALRVQEFTKRDNMLLLNGDVQIFVRAGLFTEECIDTPSTIDPDFDAQILKTRVYIDDINWRHFNSLRLPFFNHLSRILILSQSHEFRMPQMVTLGPLQKFDLRHKFRPEPNVLFHVFSGQTLAPSWAMSLGQIDKRTL